MTSGLMERVVVRPEQGTTGAAIWADGWMMMPLCGSESCLENPEKFCVLMDSQDWICGQCGRPHGIIGTDRTMITKGMADGKETLAAWLGVSVESIDISWPE